MHWDGGVRKGVGEVGKHPYADAIVMGRRYTPSLEVSKWRLSEASHGLRWGCHREKQGWDVCVCFGSAPGPQVQVPSPEIQSSADFMSAAA